MSLRAIVPGALVVGALALAPPAPAAAQVDRDAFDRLVSGSFLLIGGATVIDGTGGLPRANTSVLIRNGTIEFVGRRDDIVVPEGARVIDARGGWLVPGFIDVHAHAGDPGMVEGLLAAGITSARSPGSPSGNGLELRNAVKTGDVRGPRLVSSGPVIDSPPGNWPGSVLVETEEEARQAVRRQAEAGADLIKLYIRLPPALVAAAVDEAHAHGLPVVGELVVTSWTAAVRAGIDHLSHLVSRSPALLPPEARPAYERDVAERRAHPYYRWLELLQPTGPELDEMVGALLAWDVSVDPTLAAVEAVLFCGDSAYVAEVSPLTGDAGSAGSADDAAPGGGDAAPEASGDGGAAVTEGAAAEAALEGCAAEGWPDDFLERARAAWPKALDLVGRLHRQGVRLTAGSDAPFGRLPVGASFHRELALLVEAGIPNREVIRIATVNGAVALDMLHEAGTIETGKRADMVLLGGDPLEDIRSTRDIRWVMLDGKTYAPGGPGDEGDGG